MKALILKVSVGSENIKNKTIGIPLTGGVTVINGNSNVGKTYLFKRLEELGIYNGKRIIAINLRNFRLLQDLNTAFNNDIVVIDDFEVIVMIYPECLKWINTHYAPIILFTRVLTGVRIDNMFLFDLILENKELYLRTVIGQARVPESGKNPLLKF